MSVGHRAVILADRDIVILFGGAHNFRRGVADIIDVGCPGCDRLAQHHRENRPSSGDDSYKWGYDFAKFSPPGGWFRMGGGVRLRFVLP